MTYTITLSKTRDGKHDYMQIISADQFSTNIVLIADKINIRDVRPEQDKATKS